MKLIEIRTALIVLCAAAAVSAQPSAVDAVGDPLPPGVLARLGSNQFTHSSLVDQVAFTADGKTVVFAGREFLGRWAIADGKPIGRAAPPAAGMWNLLLAPDGSTVVQASPNTNVGAIVVDTATGRERFRLPKPEPVWPVLGWGRGGQTILVSSGAMVRIWDMTAKRELAQWKTAGTTAIVALAGSPDGTRVAVLTTTGDVTLHEADTGKELRTIAKATPPGKWRFLKVAMAFSPDGKKLLVGLDQQMTSLWDLATGNRVTHFAGLGEKATAYAAAWSPDGRVLAVGGTDSKVRLLDATTGKVTATLDARTTVSGLRFSPDRRLLAGFGNTYCPELWDATTGKPLYVKTGHRGPVLSLAFTTPGRVATGGQDGQLIEWELKSGRVMAALELRSGSVRSLVPAGSVLLFCSGGQFAKWKPGENQPQPLAWEQPSGIEGAVSANGRVFACLRETGSIQCFEVAGGKKLGSMPITDDYDSNLYLSPDGRYLALRVSTDEGSFLRIWRTSDGRLVRTLGSRDDNLASVAIAPTGRTVATIGELGRVRIWEMATGANFEIKARFASPTAITFSPDSRTIFIGNFNGEVWGYDLLSGDVSGPHPGHRGAVDALAVSPDGATLVTGSADTTALVWDAAAVRPKPRAVPRPAPDDLARWWKDLAAPGGAPVRAALGGLAASPKDALPFLKIHMKSPPLPPRDRIDGWVYDLDSPRFAVREAASRGLAALGEDVTELLKDARPKAATAEGRRRIDLLLRDADGPLPVANLQLLRGLEALELIGGPDAKAILAGLAAAADDTWLKREARASLARVTVAGER